MHGIEITYLKTSLNEKYVIFKVKKYSIIFIA